MGKATSQGREPWDWFGDRLRELREAANLSRPQLAEQAGMRSEAGIRNIEQGISSPTWETVCRLCAALGVDCTAFLQPPTETTRPGRGRPRKAAAEPSPPPPADQPETKQPRKRKGK
jgi:transcriptional regulator with XRE-family HTH domain